TLFGRVNLERSIGSSAGKKVRTFEVGRTCRGQEGRSSRQASNTGVVPAEGSPMLKSAICGNFGRICSCDGRIKFPIVLKTIDGSTSQLCLVCKHATASNENPSRLLKNR
ncbi:unnamed protein product, partial [Prunus brigantina]